MFNPTRKPFKTDQSGCISNGAAGTARHCLQAAETFVSAWVQSSAVLLCLRFAWGGRLGSRVWGLGVQGLGVRGV